jgi:guanylate kinase
MNIQRRGIMLVLSSPSGAGKTTLSRLLLENDPDISLSISVTTRPPRPTEIDGVHYHFISQDEFDLRREKEEFFEHAYIFGYYYATPKAPVLEVLEKGKDILFDIDWQGTQQLSLAARSDMVPIFILPPSLSALEERLRSRAQDSEYVVQERMNKALSEISHWAEYEYVVFNEYVEKSLVQLQSILNAERLKKDRQLGLAEFVRGL